MYENDKISVIITTFKREKEVFKRALLSVLNQTYNNIEVIIVDDNGDQNNYRSQIKDVVQGLQTRKEIKLIQHESNLGAQKSRNTGIKNAYGQYIAFLDDDDEWLKDKLKSQKHKFEESSNRNLGLVYCGYNSYKQINEDYFSKTVKKPEIQKGNMRKKLFYGNFIGSTSFPLIKKECFDKVGYFDESLEAKQDLDMWIRIVKYYDIECIQAPLGNYYVHSLERISNNTKKKINAEKTFLNKYFSEIKEDKKAFSKRLKTIGKYYLKEDDYKNSRKFFQQSIKVHPLDYKLYVLFIISTLQYKPIILKKRL